MIPQHTIRFKTEHFSKRFGKEVLLALVIFLLPLLIYLHVLFENVYPSSISTNEYFISLCDKMGLEPLVWVLITNFAWSALLLLWFCTTNRRFKIYILFPLSYFVFSFINSFYIGSFLSYYGLLFLVITYHLFWRYHFKDKDKKIIRTNWKKGVWASSFVLFFATLILYISYFYPENSKSITFFGLDFGNFGFTNADAALYQLLKKTTILSCFIDLVFFRVPLVEICLALSDYFGS